MRTLARFKIPLIIWLLFEAVAVGLWLGLDNIFYLFNFTYIGTCLAVGMGLFSTGKAYARKFTQIAVGSYMLVYLGFICRENMQIEGFWYYLFLGVFEGATIHYLVAKIAGPLVFGRGWCGYACWTAMVLDLLPWKKSAGRKARWGAIRYILALLSLAFVGALMVAGIANDELMFAAFIVGNIAYYGIGIGLAFAFRENRAFCKYICPVGVLMKPASLASFMRVKCDSNLCVKCGKCLKVCPMDVDMLDGSRRRKNASECILCLECAKSCPKGALKL